MAFRPLRIVTGRGLLLNRDSLEGTNSTISVRNFCVFRGKVSTYLKGVGASASKNCDYLRPARWFPCPLLRLNAALVNLGSMSHKNNLSVTKRTLANAECNSTIISLITTDYRFEHSRFVRL